MRRELAELQEHLNQMAREYGIEILRSPYFTPAPAGKPAAPAASTTTGTTQEMKTSPVTTIASSAKGITQEMVSTLGTTPQSVTDALLSPASHYLQVSSNVKQQTLNDLKLEEYQTKGIVPAWNGRKETFWLFRMNALLQRNNAIWSALTIIKVQGETVDVITNPFKATDLTLLS